MIATSASHHALPLPARAGAAPMRVSELMSTPVITAPPALLLADVARLFEKHRVSAVPVVDRGMLLGVVSTTDLVARGSAANDGVLCAGDVMSAPALVARTTERVDDAAHRMVSAGVHRLVVVDGADVVGILAARDVLEEVMARPIEEPLRTAMTTPVEAISLGDTIATALRRLASARVHGLIVVEGMSPIGLFTHAEAVACQRLPPELLERPVEEVMSHRLLCLDASTKIRRAAAYASVMNARRMVVLEREHLVGIVSSLDLVRALACGAS